MPPPPPPPTSKLAQDGLQSEPDAFTVGPTRATPGPVRQRGQRGGSRDGACGSKSERESGPVLGRWEMCLIEGTPQFLVSTVGFKRASMTTGHMFIFSRGLKQMEEKNTNHFVSLHIVRFLGWF